MTYQANKYALNSGDVKVKEAHISVIYPSLKDDKLIYTIFNPGLKIDKPLSFYPHITSNGAEIYDYKSNKISKEFGNK